MTTILCGRPCCENLRAKTCSACNEEGYCGHDCQKSDWKIHRIMCACLKNGYKLLPFKEVKDKFTELKRQAELQKKAEDQIRILEYCLSFVKVQYGKEIVGKPYRERDIEFDGLYRIDNWGVDVVAKFTLCDSLGDKYRCSTIKENMDVTAGKDVVNKAIYYYEKSLFHLEPWKVRVALEENDVGKIFDEVKIDDIFDWRKHPDSERSKRVDGFEKLDDERIASIYGALSTTEMKLNECHMHLEKQNMRGKYHESISGALLYDYEIARDYLDRGISHAKKIMMGDYKIVFLYKSLALKGDTFSHQSKFREAKVVYEELYNMLAETFNPDHPQTLRAANLLINVLIEIEEYEDAERFARISYECLRSKDTQSIEIANAAEALAYVTCKLI